MSNDVNQLLLEKAVELADELNDEQYYEELEQLVNDSDLEGVWELCKIMRADARWRKT